MTPDVLIKLHFTKQLIVLAPGASSSNARCLMTACIPSSCSLKSSRWNHFLTCYRLSQYVLSCRTLLIIPAMVLAHDCHLIYCFLYNISLLYLKHVKGVYFFYIFIEFNITCFIKWNTCIPSIRDFCGTQPKRYKCNWVIKLQQQCLLPTVRKQ